MAERWHDADRMRDYRRRVKDGEPIGAPIDAPAIVPAWSEGQRAEVESAWQVAYRRAFAGWLLGFPSEHTRRAYTQAWRCWEQFCLAAGEDAVNPGPGAGGGFMGAMEAAGLSPATRKVRRSAVAAALSMLTIEGLRMGGDPFARVKAPRVPDVSSSLPVSDELVRRLLEVARTMPGRFEAAVGLCAVVGLRSFEAGQVCEPVLSRLELDGTAVDVAQLVRKGGKRASLPIPPAIVAAGRRDRWPWRDGMAVAANAEHVQYLVGRVGEAAGTPVRCHQLRHWHVTTALREGVPLEKVQDSVGHADPRTTQRYNQARGLIVEHSAWVVAGVVGADASVGVV